MAKETEISAAPWALRFGKGLGENCMIVGIYVEIKPQHERRTDRRMDITKLTVAQSRADVR